MIGTVSIGLIVVLCVMGYIALGLVVALCVALTWKRPGDPEMRLHLFGWPLTLLMVAYSVIRDGINGVIGWLEKIAHRDRAPAQARPKKSLFERFRTLP